MKNVLISGGSGLIGTMLSKALRERGYTVTVLTRKQSNNSGYIHWDISNNFIQENALSNIDTIIHLAGEGIAEKRWTNKRKSEITESRIQSTRLLFDTLSTNKHHVKQFIAASAIGYYSDRCDELMMEDDLPANDFLGKTCELWEKEIDRIESLSIRTVKLRTGIVLSNTGGALKKMSIPFKFGFGSALGNGEQWMSWIHEEDLCNMYIHAIENETMRGAYNAVAPNPVTNNSFGQVLANVLARPYWFPAVPSWVLKLILGEMSTIILGSTKASASKIVSTNFNFKYTNLRDCLENLYTKK